MATSSVSRSILRIARVVDVPRFSRMTSHLSSKLWGNAAADRPLARPPTPPTESSKGHSDTTAGLNFPDNNAASRNSKKRTLHVVSVLLPYGPGLSR